jgi:hypothetical protein
LYRNLLERVEVAPLSLVSRTQLQLDQLGKLGLNVVEQETIVNFSPL